MQLYNKMEQDIASAINRALVHQQAPDHIWIMNATWNAKEEITVIMHQTATAEMALQYSNIFITAERTFKKRVFDVEGNESGERWQIHAVPAMWYMGNCVEGMHKVGEEFDKENMVITIVSQVRCLPIPWALRERGRAEKLPHYH